MTFAFPLREQILRSTRKLCGSDGVCGLGVQDKSKDRPEVTIHKSYLTFY